MNTAFLGETINVIGVVMVAFTAVMVHRRVWKEHRIDEKVFRTMHKEQAIGLVGITLIVIGYLLKVPPLI